MYPGMAKQARDEGFGEIADWFETLAKAERSHANRFQKALDQLCPIGDMREGSLEAPTRHPLAWKNPEFWDQAKAEKELERIFDICHGCRRCVSLCTTFPDALRPRRCFDNAGGRRRQERGLLEGRRPVLPLRPLLHDEVPVRSAASVERRLPARHAAREGDQVQARTQSTSPFRDRLLSSTDAMGKLAAIPVVAQTVNAVNKNSLARSAMQAVLGVHKDRELPPYAPRKFRSPARRARLIRGARRQATRRARWRSSPPAT